MPSLHCSAFWIFLLATATWGVIQAQRAPRKSYAAAGGYQYSYIAQVKVTLPDKTTQDCACAILSDSYAITSAQCVVDAMPSNIRVTIEGTTVADNPGTIGSIVIHDKFNRYSLKHDIALLKFFPRLYLNEPAVMAPVTKNGVTNSLDTQLLRVVGFGAQGKGTNGRPNPPSQPDGPDVGAGGEGEPPAEPEPQPEPEPEQPSEQMREMLEEQEPVPQPPAGKKQMREMMDETEQVPKSPARKKQKKSSRQKRQAVKPSGGKKSMWYADVSQMSMDSCNSKVSDLYKGYPDTMSCVQAAGNTKSTCLADKGSLVLYKPKAGFTFLLVGIVSEFGRCGSNYPTAYTRIGPYMQWISNYVRDDLNEVPYPFPG